MVRKKKRVSHRSPSETSSEPVPVDAQLLCTVIDFDQLFSNKIEQCNELIEWYKVFINASSLYDQLNELNWLRDRCKYLFQVRESLHEPNDDLCTWLQMVCRFAFRVFAANSKPLIPLKKSCGLILKEICDVIDGDEIFCAVLERRALHTISEEIERFAQTLALEEATQSIGDANTARCKIDTLYSILELPLVPLMLSYKCKCQTYVITIKICLHHLESFCHSLKNSNCVNPNEVRITGVAEACSGPFPAAVVDPGLSGAVLKCLILIFSSTNKQLQCAAICPATEYIDNCRLQWKRVLQLSLVIIRHEIISKDLLTQAGHACILALRKLLLAKYRDKCTTFDPDTAIGCCLLHVLGVCTLVDLNMLVCVEQSIETETIIDISTLPHHGILSLYRAFINSSTNKELLHSGSDEHEAGTSFFTKVVTRICGHSEVSSMAHQVYSVQVLGIVLERVAALLFSAPRQFIGNETLDDTLCFILLLWDHPSKKINYPMPTHFKNFLYICMKQQMASPSSTVSKVLRLPLNSRAKYAALAILLKLRVLHFSALQQREPNILQIVVDAIGQSELYAIAVDLLVNVLSVACGDSSNLLSEFLHAIVRAITEQTHSILMTHGLPLLYKVLPVLLLPLCQELRRSRELYPAHSQKLLRAYLCAVRYARKNLSLDEATKSEILFPELVHGLQNQKAAIRGAALDALVSSRKSTESPTRTEYSLLQKYLVASCSIITPATRTDTLIAMKRMLLRAKSVRRPVVAAKQNILDYTNACAFFQWIQVFVRNSIYMGSVPQRTIMGLEVLSLYLEIFIISTLTSECVIAQSSAVIASASLLMNVFHLLLSPWDTVRSLSYKILEMFPLCYPKWTANRWRNTFHWGLQLCSSVQQRESNAGALIVRFIYTRLVYLSKQEIFFSEIAPAQDLAGSGHRVLLFSNVLASLQNRLDAWEKSLDDLNIPLYHGLFLALRYMLQDSTSTELSSPEYKSLIQSSLACIQRSVKLSMSRIGDRQSGNGEIDDDEYTVVGEVLGKNVDLQGRLKVDCRGHLIYYSEMDGAQSDKTIQCKQQHVVIGSWLAVRESGELLRVIIETDIALTDDDGTRCGLLMKEDIQHTGQLLLTALIELKHQGAIASVYQSFEKICQALNHNVHSEVVHASLPSLWADTLLQRLQSSEQQFILRRSSGFALSFLAILRAEPAQTATAILPKVIQSLLEMAQSSEFQECDAKNSTFRWRSRVHALNILKLICQDAVLADDMRQYITKLLRVSISGFESASWAIRNSSLMLFAAATQRAIGKKRIADNATLERVSGTSLFSRHPGIQDFLYGELKRSCHVKRESIQKYQSSSSNVYYVLMILSRLESTEDECDDENFPLSTFIPFVMQCGEQKGAAVREMAARALASIVPYKDIVKVLVTLMEKIQNCKVLSTTEVSRDCSTNLMDNNSVHGTLLQIKHLLLRLLCSVKSDRLMDDNLRDFLSKKLLPCLVSFLAHETLCNSISAQIMRALHCLYSFPILQSCLESDVEFQRLTHTIRTRCHNNLIDVSDIEKKLQPVQLPGLYEFNQACTELHLKVNKISNQNGQNSLADITRCLIQCPSLEIRLIVIRDLFEEAKQHILPTNQTALIQTICEQFQKESHAECKVALLQLCMEILYCKPDKQANGATSLLLEILEKELWNVLHHSRHTKLIETALLLVSKLCNPADRQNRNALWSERCQKLGSLLTQQTLQKSSTTSQLSIAKSLRHSHLLREYDCLPTSASQSWVVAIVLLQSDDPKARKHACLAILNAIQTAYDPSQDMNVSESHALARAIDFLVHQLPIEPIFSWVDHCFQQLIITPCADIPSMLHSVYVSNQLTNAALRPIFQTDVSDSHMETEVIVQHFVRAIITAPNQISLSECVRKAVFCSFIKSVDELIPALQCSDTIDIFYQSSVFPQVYSLMCLVLLCICMERDEDVIDGVLKAAATLRAFITKENCGNVDLMEALQLLESDFDRAQIIPLLFLTTASVENESNDTSGDCTTMNKDTSFTPIDSAEIDSLSAQMEKSMLR